LGGAEFCVRKRFNIARWSEEAQSFTEEEKDLTQRDAELTEKRIRPRKFLAEGADAGGDDRVARGFFLRDVVGYAREFLLDYTGEF
jgi:hypothetical protein